jgi:glyoxylase-like metal-dependent hydrolase (beta-lactamase superfamily II)/rhodanese-related sulfurtransferase
MIFEQIRTNGCLSYVVGCADSRAGVVIDPALDQVDRYLAVAAERGIVIRYVVDSHTHADHFSAALELSRRLGVPAVSHRQNVAPYVSLRVDDGELLIVGKLKLRVLHTPGHTADSMCLALPDRIFTGDTLLIGGTGRTDLPTGDPEALYDSLFNKLLRQNDDLLVFPAHDYKGRSSSTLGKEKAENPRLQKKERGAFVELMRGLDIAMPTHLTEALRTNRSGGKTVAQLIADAARETSFMGMEEVRARIGRDDVRLVLLDVREKDAFEAAHLPGARHVPRGQLELRIDKELPDPTTPILAYCQFGMISTLAAATLRTMGYSHVVALDGGMQAWVDAGYPVERRGGVPEPDAKRSV